MEKEVEKENPLIVPFFSIVFGFALLIIVIHNLTLMNFGYLEYLSWLIVFGVGIYYLYNLMNDKFKKSLN